MGSMDTAALLDRLTPAIVGRRREVELVVAALGAARHVVLEGPPGTGKSSMLRAVAHELGIGFELVEGNAELTPARLVGHFDPALVLAEGYSTDNFVDGPLLAALRSGGLLYIEELNRVPEETLNVLVTVMSEREVTVPRLGRVVAEPGFRFVAAMNPFDSVGTARISAAISDRVCRIAVGYQTADDECAIVRRHVADIDAGWLDRAVDLVRRTREHPDVRVGSSVRGAIDLCALAPELARLRASTIDDRDVGLDAACAALSGRIRVRDGSGRDADDIIAELWRAVFAPPEGRDADAGKGRAPNGANHHAG
jgi:MoxR-like ATPase